MSNVSTTPPSVLREAAAPTGGAEAALYADMVNGQKSALLGLMFYTGLACLVLAGLGHPVAAGVGLLACWLADWRIQVMLRRVSFVISASEAERGMNRLGRIVLLRGALVFAAPATAVVIRTDTPTLVLLMMMACGYLLVALCQCLMSRRLFWMSAAAPLAAITVAMFCAMQEFRDLALLGAALWLAGLLWVIDVGVKLAKAEWTRAQEEKNRLLASTMQAYDDAVAKSVEAERLREEAGRANQAKSTFLATMSHEIRTPMNGVLGMAHLLRRSKLNARQTQQIETIIQSGEFLLAILNDILDLSKIDAGRMDIATSPTDLRQLMEQMLLLWRPRADEKGLALTLHIDPDVAPHVLADALRLRQVLFNLLGNALKFTERGGVAVRLLAEPGETAQGRLITFQVADTGVGIPAEALPLLFARFSQVDDFEIRRFGGTGLGLAVCKQLSELMGGQMAVKSVHGRGSTFSLTLPLEAIDRATQAQAEPAAAADHDAARGLEILATDDNPTNLLVLDHLLHAFGHGVTKASSGAEALELLRLRPFDLVLMDIQMPEMTGVEVLHGLRAIPGPNLYTPVIALTADALSGDRERYLALGFSEHVTKPIDVPRLAEAMDAALAPPAAASAIAVA